MAEVNRRFRWANMQLLSEVDKGGIDHQAWFLIGHSYGEYNGCLGPPPLMLKRKGKKNGSQPRTLANELYISGTRIAREDIGKLLQMLCVGMSCEFHLIRQSELNKLRLCGAPNSSVEIQLPDAIYEWPALVTYERPRIKVLGEKGGEKGTGVDFTEGRKGSNQRGRREF